MDFVLALVSVLFCSCVSNSCFWVNAHSSNKQNQQQQRQQKRNEPPPLPPSFAIRKVLPRQATKNELVGFFSLCVCVSVSIIIFHFNSIQFNSLALFCSSNSVKWVWSFSYQTSHIDMPYPFISFVFVIRFVSCGRCAVVFFCLLSCRFHLTWFVSYERATFFCLSFFVVAPLRSLPATYNIVMLKDFFCCCSFALVIE